MDLISDIVRDFVNRSRDELALFEEGLAEWLASPSETGRLTFLTEILQSLQEMSGLLAFPTLESIFHDGRTLLVEVQKRCPEPSPEQLAKLHVLMKVCRRSLAELEGRSDDDSLANPAREEPVAPRIPLARVGGPPSPFKRSTALRGPANSLTDFIIENLANVNESVEQDAPQMGTRLVRLIDEVMSARHQIRKMFAHAASLNSEQERSAFLDQACSACPELRASLERLLKSESQSERLLQFPASELIRALLESLRGELLSPTPTTPQRPSVTLTVPEDKPVAAEVDVEATVHVRPSGAFIIPPAEEPTADPTALPRPFGRYTLEQQLGQGAMGTVYLASDRLLNRQVALKLLRVKPADGSEIVERFYREARSMASLQHANLCPIFDFGEVDGQPYLTMAYISGRPLSEYLVGGRPLVSRYAVKLAGTLATALHQAHQRGIVHRDLKPANIMINKDGEPILMDFGLARRQQPGELEITQQGMILGSPAYMAPEQVEGNIDQIGPRTDVHALGVILYEMLSGRKPFDGSVASVLAQIHSKQPELLDLPGAEGRLNTILQKAMAKTISERYESALDFAKALTEYTENSSRVRLEPGVDLMSRTEVAGPVSTDPATDQTCIIPAPRLQRWRWAVAAAAVIGICVATIKLSPPSPSKPVPLKVGSTGTISQSH